MRRRQRFEFTGSFVSATTGRKVLSWTAAVPGDSRVLEITVDALWFFNSSERAA